MGIPRRDEPGQADELLQFCEEHRAAPALQAAWQVLIVDDEPEVHDVTRLALQELVFRDRRLAFYSAYSAAEACAMLEGDNEIALVLLDVVMESDNAGLDLVRDIRERLGNQTVRIILRTGQPGQAPERSVVLDYDINDYCSKTDLTAQRLVTSVVSALRAYLAIDGLDALNRTLEAEVAERTRELQAANDHLQASLTELRQGQQAGKRVQFKLLPKRLQDFADYRFSHKLKPSEAMSGDFLDYFELDSERVVFYVADVSGHGVASAFVTVYLKRFISTCLDSFQRERQGVIEDPARLLGELNAELMREGIGKYIALFYGVIDVRSHRMTCANAGAYPWPLLRCASRPAEYIELRSSPVGMFDFASYENHSFELAEDFRLFLCSDGILDLLAESSRNEKLQRLSDQLCTPDASVEQIIDALDLSSRAPPDDVTILKIERRNDG
jgi:phosphoserine phosphatase RsbU/P